MYQQMIKLIILPLVCFALAPTAQAVSPAPDGGYANGNTAEGTNALFSLTTGSFNTASGFEALYHNTTGNSNTATGWGALFSNTTIKGVSGHNNTADGLQALYHNTTGSNNTASGLNALNRNTGGGDNTANGAGALFFNTTGSDNTASGFQALEHNNDSNNTAVGFEALFSNTSAANGDAFHGVSAQENTAFGCQALYSETTSHQDTAIGSHAMYNYNGSFILPGYDGHNTAIGSYALYNIGSQSIQNIALGTDAGRNLGSFSVYNIDIGNQGNGGGESNTIRIGTPPQPVFAWVSGQSRTFIAGIRGVTTDNDDAIPVVIDSAGQLGTVSSSARFKTEIKAMDKASEAILALKPVTFHYKSHRSDSKGMPQFGLIAEDVAKVNPDLIVRDEKGEIYTVRYEAVNAMLLNEFLKEHQKVQRLEAALAAVNERLKAQDTKIDKVNAKVELSKPAPQTVLNNQ